MEERIQKLEKEIEIIKARNKKVETDKAWELSNFRIATIALLVFAIEAFIFYFIIKNEHPFLNAIVPTVGYIISELAFESFKKWWIRNRHK
ncbi:MAG TPA: hypothetical protein VGO63_03925 [Candidatus Paceibacterota bacterium]|jgi:hypothetical protein|nr:hypothetical protein [Candidatus Paceibacterota bacterium]